MEAKPKPKSTTKRKVATSQTKRKPRKAATTAPGKKVVKTPTKKPTSKKSTPKKSALQKTVAKKIKHPKPRLQNKTQSTVTSSQHTSTFADHFVGFVSLIVITLLVGLLMTSYYTATMMEIDKTATTPKPTTTAPVYYTENHWSSILGTLVIKYPTDFEITTQQDTQFILKNDQAANLSVTIHPQVDQALAMDQVMPWLQTQRLTYTNPMVQTPSGTVQLHNGVTIKATGKNDQTLWVTYLPYHNTMIEIMVQLPSNTGHALKYTNAFTVLTDTLITNLQ